MLQARVIHCQGTRLQIIELCQRGKKVVELQRSHFDLFTPPIAKVYMESNSKGGLSRNSLDLKTLLICEEGEGDESRLRKKFGHC